MTIIDGDEVPTLEEVQAYLSEIRPKLPKGCRTARAIDNNYAWEYIEDAARMDAIELPGSDVDFEKIAEFLRDARQD